MERGVASAKGCHFRNAIVSAFLSFIAFSEWLKPVSMAITHHDTIITTNMAWPVETNFAKLSLQIGAEVTCN